MVIIGLVAPKGSGKTVVADKLCSKYNFVKFSVGDPLKHAIMHIFDLKQEQLWGNQKEIIDSFWEVTPRELMQYIGTDIFRETFSKKYPNIGKNIWVLSLEKKIQDELPRNKNIVIDDIRFPNEMALIEKYNGHIIKIHRPSLSSNDEHISENALNNTTISNILINNENDFDGLYDQIDSLLKKIGK